MKLLREIAVLNWQPFEQAVTVVQPAVVGRSEIHGLTINPGVGQ